MLIQCPYCNQNIEAMVFVHGHYQCPKCKVNCINCCDGESAQPKQSTSDKGSFQIGKGSERKDFLLPKIRRNYGN